MKAIDLSAERLRLKEALHEAIGMDPVRFSDEIFNGLALRLFAHQYGGIPPYRRLCDFHNLTPLTVKDYRLIPPVATSMYREKIFFAGEDDEISYVFSTSGTTGGNEKRGRSFFSREGLDLMERSILVNAKRMLFPDIDRTHILVMAPPPSLAPNMIMSWGMDRLVRSFGTDESTFLIGNDGLDIPRLAEQLQGLCRRNEPVTLIGATFGFVNLIDKLREIGKTFSLPYGSRIMDAGGYKGRSRKLTREELRSQLEGTFGVPSRFTVNLLGMTELASQLYDDTIAECVAGRQPAQLKQNPPWTRTRVVNPLTLQDVMDDEEGVLLHMDLANLDTPMSVLTDDTGRRNTSGFSISGRLADDSSRGCSLTVDELTNRKT